MITYYICNNSETGILDAKGGFYMERKNYDDIKIPMLNPIIQLLVCKKLLSPSEATKVAQQIEYRMQNGRIDAA